jgi:dienelactone hydrolase
MSRALLLLLALSLPVFAQKEKALPREYLPAPYDAYFRARVEALSSPDWINDITPENWPERRAAMRAQLARMLGLDPMPERTELHPVVTGTVQGDGYRVEKLHFQSRPGLYVTGDLYLPADTSKPCPTILYVCGHALVQENNVSMGNKTGYQHHGSWFARHGYVCFIIDTIELGEIRGEHHGTFSKDRWWWAGRGYTPAGVEAWNAMRALDYLETRPEVDKARFGITGRSGGGAYSWYTAALDERIKAAVPTAGITTLKNHILDGCIEGHCDCMFMVNSIGWDFDRVAALIAPRALCIANTDKDPIFPIDGVMDVYTRVRRLYKNIGKEENIGLQIAEGGHKDTQPLNTGAFHWMNRFLKGADAMDLTDEPARKLHQPAELKVFGTQASLPVRSPGFQPDGLPQDEKVTTADEWFVPQAAPPAIAASTGEWERQKTLWMRALAAETFHAWPAEIKPRDLVTPTTQSANGLTLTSRLLQNGSDFPITLWLLHRENLKPEDAEITVLNVLDDAGEAEFSKMCAGLFASPGGKDDFEAERRMFQNQNWVMAYVEPRGVGASSLANLPERKRTQILRRFHLIGETLESGQVLDIRTAAAALPKSKALWLQAENGMAANAVYASLYIDGLARLDLHHLPATHAKAPVYLNVLRQLDLPQAVALAADRCTVALYTNTPDAWSYPRAISESLHWPAKRLQFRKEPE